MSELRPRVLVIDDEESMRFFLRRALARRGFEVETAADGDDGLARFAAAPPDAVLLDVRLPGMGGHEVLERIRAADPSVPVLMMTGFASVDDAMGAMWAGATDYVRKPLKADEVASALERALSARRRGTPGPATVRALAAPGALASSPPAPAGPAGGAAAPPPPAPPAGRPGAGAAPRRPRAPPRGGRAPARGGARAPRGAAPPAPAAPGGRAGGAAAPPPRDPAAWLRVESEARGLPGAADGGDLSLDEAVRRFERILVDELLRRSGGNVARAARAAGISRPNFHRKMRALGLDAGPYRKG